MIIDSMKTNNEIRQLVDRFYSGDTTCEEEQELKSLLGTIDEKSEFFATKQFFDFCDEECAIDELGDDFDKRFMSRVKVHKISSFRRNMFFSSPPQSL